MFVIEKLILRNFKRFKNLELKLGENLNILVGCNEAGKSSILQALDIALSGNQSSVRKLLETLFNAQCIEDFLKVKTKKFENLPKLLIEVYLKPDGDIDNLGFDGRNNIGKTHTCGVRMICEPVEDFRADIEGMWREDNPISSFPFEYYDILFNTFAGSRFKKPLRHLLIDSSQITSEYATREYTRTMYVANTGVGERHEHGCRYRDAKLKFRNEIFKRMNDALNKYKFGIRTSPKANVETDLIIIEDDIPIENKGTGRQCFIKTEFALSNRKLDVVLLEEPENHLSHVYMRKLIDDIKISQFDDNDTSQKKQLIVATHSSFIATRLDLKNVLVLSEENPNRVVSLNDDLSQDTAKFFMKGPDNNVLELVLSKKVILVEGHAEFILMDTLYKKSTKSEANPEGASYEADCVHIISVNGVSFKRYLELAKLLKIRVAVIRDNDGDYQKNCEANYEGYVSEYIQIFADDKNDRHTFEVCIYKDNEKICEELFTKANKSDVLKYMLNNKAEAAFKLLEKGADLDVPKYIRKAIEWIRE